MWRVTQDARYREMGWSMFQSFLRHSRTLQGAFAIVQVSKSYNPCLVVKPDGRHDALRTPKIISEMADFDLLRFKSRRFMNKGRYWLLSHAISV